jgi:hypothetical protein
MGTLTGRPETSGDTELEPADKVFLIKTKADDLPVTTRGIKILAGKGKESGPAEFAEASAEVTTGK